MRESAYAKASRLLAEGRVIVTELAQRGITATVRGEGHVYVTTCHFRVWECTCENPRPTCSHIAALKRISSIDLPERNQ